MAEVMRSLVVGARRDGALSAVTHVLKHGIGVDELDGEIGERHELCLAR